MSHNHALSVPVAPSLPRVVAFFGGLIAFFLIAKAIDPTPSSALPLHDPLGAVGTPGWEQGGAGSEGRLIGELVGARYRVLVHASGQGPKYTVCDLGGNVLASGLHADDVYRVFPELDILNMTLDPAAGESRFPGPVMVVDAPLH